MDFVLQWAITARSWKKRMPLRHSERIQNILRDDNSLGKAVPLGTPHLKDDQSPFRPETLQTPTQPTQSKKRQLALF